MLVLREVTEALSLIALSEIADKTMIAIVFSVEKPMVREVLAKVSIATLAFLSANIIPLCLGGILRSILRLEYATLLSSILFIIVGVLNLRAESFNVSLARNLKLLFTIVFLSELGDKTQLAFFAIVIKSLNPILPLLGAILGFYLVNFIASLVYSQTVLKIVDIKRIRRITALIFIAVGLIMLISLLRDHL